MFSSQIELHSFGLFSSRIPPIILGLGSLGIIRFNDWYVLRRAAQRGSSIQALEALLAVDDTRSKSNIDLS